MSQHVLSTSFQTMGTIGWPKILSAALRSHAAKWPRYEASSKWWRYPMWTTQILDIYSVFQPSKKKWMLKQIKVQEHDLSHITAQQSHHVWRAPRKAQVTSRRWSHITDIMFWKNSLRAPMNPANHVIIFFSIRITKSLRTRSPYAIFKWNVCIIHSRLHWGAGFGRSVVYASIIAIYIGALVLAGWRADWLRTQGTKQSDRD